MVMQKNHDQQQQHFLVVTFPAQGHINPALQLAKRLVRAGARVTFATTVSAHRRIFSSASAAAGDHNREETPPSPPPLLSYAPYSDGYDDGFNPATDDTANYMAQIKVVGSETLAGVARSLAAAGRPVTCVIYTLLLPWAAEVARDLSIPSFLFWIQPASVFAVYYHYFHGHSHLISTHQKDPWFSLQLPALPPLRIRDLPSFLVPAADESGYHSFVLPAFEEMFSVLDDEAEISGEKKLKVLVNTFDSLEHDQLYSVEPVMELVPIGPLLPSAYTDGKDQSDKATGGDLFKAEAREKYMGWLDSKAEGSVVYVSFGSILILPPKQREEISWGLEESRRPYLWVARGIREEVTAEAEDGNQGMVVEWCSQVEVLSHPAVGSFVTHCGWNSTLESVACGVPTVGLPQWTDQPTNARLAEVEWGVGVRAEPGGDGIVEAVEMRRCLDLVMGEGEKGVEIRRNARKWSEMAREAVREGGPSDRNLRAFVEEIGLRRWGPAEVENCNPPYVCPCSSVK